MKMKLRQYILPRSIGDILSFLFIILILPVGYWFEVFIVFPATFQLNSFSYIFHCIISTVLLINITSNFVYMVLMDTSIQGKIMPSTILNTAWKFCDICETVTPPRSWHCGICNVCILKRDHHCQFAGCCIGHYNQRYFFYFLTYLALACIYALYFNTLFIRQYISFNFMSFLKITFPLAMLLLGVDHSVENCYILFYVINLLGMITATFLLYYHGSSMARGLIMYEKSHGIYDYDSGSVSENLLHIFGERWYLTWIAPFFSSTLPSDGVNWRKCNPKAK